MNATEPLFVFFGTPEISVRVLEALEHHGMLPALVVTAPDAPRGRKLQLTPSPVKVWAEVRGIEVLQPTSLRDPQLVATLANTPWDVFVVAMYAKLIPNELLEMPAHGVLNVHPSLLPKFRGPSPVLSAILADERATGVSIMQLTEGMDEGPVLAQAKIELEESEWPPKGSELEELLSTEGGNLLAEILPEWLGGAMQAESQDNSLATYTQKFSASDAQLDLAGDARANFLKIRAFDASPRAYFISPTGKRVIVTAAAYKDGQLEILTVIPEGKKEMPYAEYLRGQK